MRPESLLHLAGLSAAGPPQPLSGGDMGQVWRLGEYVVKTHPSPPPGLFPAEGRGLMLLAAAGARTPAVYWAGEEGIVLSYLPPGTENWEELATMLAHLHGKQSAAYGSSHPVFLGRFPLPPGRSKSWRSYWVEYRLEPLLAATRKAQADLAGHLERFIHTFEWPAEGPALIHGDLWSGNVLMTASGPALIDPSAWCGERALDLAMMRLFGGFPPAFWSAYEELRPVSAEVQEALPAYQLYFLLVHLHFFGAGYLSGIRRTLNHYGFI